MATYKKRGYKPKTSVEKEVELEAGSTTAEVFSSLDEGASRTEAWVENNQKSIFTVVAVIAVGVLAYIAYQKFVFEPKQNEAANEIYQASSYFEQALTATEQKDSLYLMALNGNAGRYGLLDIAEKFEDIIPEIISNGYSRIPVFEDIIDKVIGVLYVKDLLPHLNKKAFEWQSILREPFFVPENKKLDDLMTEFQQKKVHLAIVVDEYGGTSGVISLEDIIEEIVGDISDEFDDDDIIYSKINDSNYVFEGKTSLKDFYKIIKLEDESIFESKKGESETLAGFVLEISKSFPKIKTQYKFKNYTFTIEGIDNKRIKQIKVSIKR